MVVYSFKRRYSPHMLSSMNAQNIRADRVRHMRQGEELQFLTRMWTRNCTVLGRPTRPPTMSVRLRFLERSASELFEIGSEHLSPAAMEAFAIADGFADVEYRARFRWAEHSPEGGDRIAFDSVLFRWQSIAAETVIVTPEERTDRA